jgi:DNA-binding TFAR19-related protein (PDSD5 family)
MVKGGKIAQQAVETVKQAAQEGRVKDAMRAEVATLILKAISTYFKNNIGIILTDCRRNHASQSCSPQSHST